MRWTYDAACPPDLVEAYSAVAEVDESAWLSELRAMADKAHTSLPANARHLAVYFDHSGCLEVVADDFRLLLDGGPESG